MLSRDLFAVANLLVTSQLFIIADNFYAAEEGPARAPPVPLWVGVPLFTSTQPTIANMASNWVFTRSDRRTDRSVRRRLRPTVCQTSRTDRSDRL